MGAVASLATAALAFVPLVVQLVGVICAAFSGGHARENPVMAELEKRIQEQQRDLEAASAEQSRAEEACRLAEEAYRQSEEQRAQLEESTRRQIEQRARA